MNFNSIIFPAPESCYEYRLIENILWVPKTQEKQAKEDKASDPNDETAAEEESPQIKDSKKPSKGLFSKFVSKKAEKFGNQSSIYQLIISIQFKTSFLASTNLIRTALINY